MKVKRLEVYGLFGRRAPIKVDFNDDVNIITGRNGAGKTTFLKLLWYILSGNITQAALEIDFDTVFVETSSYNCRVFRQSETTCKAEFQLVGEPREIIEDNYGNDGEDGYFLNDARDVLSERISPIGSSLFFPTFRRIEGGFSMIGSKGSSTGQNSRPTRDLEDAMTSLSRKLSREQHTFVSSISTVDVESLLLKSYAELSEKSNKLQQNVSAEIIEKIRGYRNETEDFNNTSAHSIFSANMVIDDVQRRIESMELERQSIMSSLNAVQALASRLFGHTGIKFGRRINFGEAASAINSDALSAGEKQMLSFICYNAFRSDCVVLIDEPELSLHVDWQRSLFPTLLEQESGNQFIIATHSPFIYSKYPDKELCIDVSEDRGDKEEWEAF